MKTIPWHRLILRLACFAVGFCIGNLFSFQPQDKMVVEEARYFKKYGKMPWSRMTHQEVNYWNNWFTNENRIDLKKP